MTNQQILARIEQMLELNPKHLEISLEQDAYSRYFVLTDGGLPSGVHNRLNKEAFFACFSKETDKIWFWISCAVPKDTLPLGVNWQMSGDVRGCYFGDFDD